MNHKISLTDLLLHYGDFHALKGVSIEIKPEQVTAIIGPSGCGKSTFLRCLNRMNDTIEGVKIQGRITIDGDEILGSRADLIHLRKKVGMVFQRPNPFPLSIYENVMFGLKIHHFKENKDEIVVVNKTDLSPEEKVKEIVAVLGEKGLKVIAVSAGTQKSGDNLKKELNRFV